MKTPTDIGSNRTGIKASPIDSKRTIEGAKTTTPFSATDSDVLAAERRSWADESDPVGTMPPPASLGGAVKTGVELLRGHKPNVFLDKLGERAAYERTGTRLWEALMVKIEAADVHEGGPTIEDAEQIRADEVRHFALVRDAIASLGGDPTAMTPCADVSGVMGMGLVQVLTDPRTTLTQCLDAMLVAELTDTEAWLHLADLADALGHDELAERFRVAFHEEEQHLVRVRAWITAALHGQAGVPASPPRDARA